MAILAGIHPVLEALGAARPLERVHIARGAGGARVQAVIDACRKAGVPVRFEERAALDRISRAATHQGVVAIAGDLPYASLGDLLGTKLVVVLDGVEDPHNLGAVARTAHAAGAGALVIPERRAAGVTPAAAKAAAGALEHLPVARVGNLNRALEDLKNAGYWIYGLDERGEFSYDSTVYNIPTALVAGGEGKGLHQQVKKHCDALVRIPLAGRIASLNVSVAMGIVLFEWKRRSAGQE
jgi:23S rRNA (guanosine2251-2'-O)-methyltransferase